MTAAIRTAPADPAREIVHRIQERHARGAAMNVRGVRADARELELAANRRFGNWAKALRASGIDPLSVARRRPWTAKQVIQAIRDLHERGVRLNYTSAHAANHGLPPAAVKQFGSWDAALRVAGFDPATMRVNRPPWTKTVIVRLIQDQVTPGMPLVARRIKPETAVLAAKRLFGSLKAAFRQAGVLPLVRMPLRWSKSRVVSEIQERSRAGKPVNCYSIVHEASDLYEAACRYVGSWSQALQAAGLDPEKVRRKRPPWTKGEVLAEVRARVAAGAFGMFISRIRPESLVHACRRFFGSVDAAVLAATGKPRQKDPLPPRPPRPAYVPVWDRQREAILARDRERAARKAARDEADRARVLAEIRRRHDSELPVNHTALQRDNPRLLTSMLRLFDKSWGRAVQAAGLDPLQIAGRTRWSREMIISRMRDRVARGLGVRTHQVQADDPWLCGAARRWFGRWDNVLDAAGIDLPRHARKPLKWTRESVIAAIHELQRAGRPLTQSAQHHHGANRAAPTLFGAWDAALIAAGIDPADVRRHCPPWTPESVLYEIRRKHAAGEALNTAALSRQSLRTRGIVFFGSWGAALAAAGLDPTEIRKDGRYGSRRLRPKPAKGQTDQPGPGAARPPGPRTGRTPPEPHRRAAQ